MKTQSNPVPQRSLQEWREIMKIDRELQRETWEGHWLSMVLHGLFTCGGGFAFGFALGLSAVVWGLTEALKV